MPKKLTKELFIEQLNDEHPELELLSDYYGNKKYVTVRCKIHNYTFNTKPNWLHRGCGCQMCYDEVRGNKTRKGTDQFIEDAKKVHGDKYDYSKVEYKNNKTKVCIICPEHGEFWQTPNKHLMGNGCPNCIGKYVTTEMFIERANKVHNNRYDYSKVNYINNSTKVCIICPEHGEFWQNPYIHTMGSCCPLCNSSKLEFGVQNILKNNGINIECGKKLPWLDRQHLDVYIPSKNLAIECQGRQHFMPVSRFDKRCTLSQRIRLDIKKYENCLDNGIKMLYVINRADKDKIFDKKFLDLYTDENTLIFEDIMDNHSLLLEKINEQSN